MNCRTQTPAVGQVWTDHGQTNIYDMYKPQSLNENSMFKMTIIKFKLENYSQRTDAYYYN